MKKENSVSQRMVKSFTEEQNCERINTCFINTKTTIGVINSENYKRGVYLHNIYKNG